MDIGYKQLLPFKTTKSRRAPQVKSSKAENHAKYHKIPVIQFED